MEGGGTDEAELSNDEQAVRRLDQSWNDVYVRNDRPAFRQPGYLGLSAYTPPPVRGQTVELLRDIRFPQAQNEFLALAIPIDHPTTVRLYVDIEQTNPQTRSKVNFATSLSAQQLFFVSGMAPEERFLQDFPNTIVHAACGSLHFSGKT